MYRRHSKGFTLVEMMLAMAFVSVLLVAIALTVIQIGKMYNKGVTLKEVNQAGSTISQDMRRVVAAATPLSVEGADATDFKLMKYSDGQVAGGRFCTGSYSYIWNLGAYLNVSNPVNVYETGTKPIHLAKVVDKVKAYCNDTTKNVDVEDTTEMLPDGNRELAVHKLVVTQIAHDSTLKQALYRISLELGTNDRSLLEQGQSSINSVDTSCKPPDETSDAQDYCAVNIFEFTARAGNNEEAN